MVVLSIPVIVAFSIIMMLSFLIGGLLLTKESSGTKPGKKIFNGIN